MKQSKRAWINGLFLLVTLAVNALGATGFINGQTQKEISDRYVTLITPSPSTFSIWSVIYTLLLISAIVMIVKKKDGYYRAAVDTVTVPFIASCVLNIAWIVFFSYEQLLLSVLFILGFVAALAIICGKLRKIQDKKRWLLPACFGLYTGWLMIASVVNIAAALVKLKWNGFGLAADLWALIILCAAILIVGLVALMTRNAALPLPVAWAYVGIYQNLKTSDVFAGKYPDLQNAALAGMVILAVLAVALFAVNRLSLLPVAAEKSEPGKTEPLQP